eukprot:7974649-Alexandrium_andersonii.AAC.1
MSTCKGTDVQDKWVTHLQGDERPRLAPQRGGEGLELEAQSWPSPDVEGLHARRLGGPLNA